MEYLKKSSDAELIFKYSKTPPRIFALFFRAFSSERERHALYTSTLKTLPVKSNLALAFLSFLARAHRDRPFYVKIGALGIHLDRAGVSYALRIEPRKVFSVITP